MRFATLLLSMILSTTCLAQTPAAAPPAPPDSRLILDRNGYFRSFVQFGVMRISPETLAKDGPSLFGKDGAPPKYEPVFRRYVRAKNVDWSGTEWMKDVRVYFFRGQLGDDTKAMERLPEVAPPAGWSGGDFDDAMWQRRRLGQRKPTRTYQENFRDSSDVLVRGVYYRTYFELTDPARAAPLTLSCRYRGGIRVLVNGQEVARKHLPTGELGPEARAEPYPREAYVLTSDETPPNRPAGVCGDLRCDFDDAPPAPNAQDFHLNASNQQVNRKGWQRFLALRDRDTGPIAIPAGMLRRGSNLLAIEVRGSDFHPQIMPGAGDPKNANWGDPFNPVWMHAQLVGLELKAAADGSAVSAVRPPVQGQVWVDDVHARLFSNDFNPPGWPVGKARIVGALNGTFAAQLGVAAGSGGSLSGLKVTPGELKSPAGTIPASAVGVFYAVAHPMSELWTLGYCRSLAGLGEWGQDSPMAWSGIYRQLSDKAQRAKGMSLLGFFDHLSPLPPAGTPANTCQPIWLSVRVPPTAPGGTYTGTVRVQADGLPATDVPLELEVVPWRVPGPMEFQTLVQSEQSPYGIAKHYKLAPWSDEHFRLIDSSFRQLARLGADWVFVPVLLDSEFGNKGDSMLKWLRRRDGSLTFDYTAMDRYLDLVVKHLGAPRVLCFNVMHGAEAPTSDVRVFDEAAGKDQVVNLGPKQPPEFRRPYWKAFILALMAHLKDKGLDKSVYWGEAFDNVYDTKLIEWTHELAPGTYWAAGGHGRRADADFRAVARAYGSDLLERSQQGWSCPVVQLLMPRTAGSIICVEGTSTPFTYRVLCDRAIYAGFNGLGRMGADYFDLAFYDGCKAGEYQLVGRSCTMTLWPGKNAIDSSTRNEVMLEGIQEAEARIFLEQTLNRRATTDELAAEVQKVLDDHLQATLYIPTSGPATDLMEITGDWQGRSRRLYQAAAKVAQRVALDVEPTELGARQVKVIYQGRESVQTEGELLVPNQGKLPLKLKLRNWSDKPRKWRAAASAGWIVPAKLEGAAAGHEELAVTLDGKDLAPGQKLSGTLTITDADSGQAVAVKIAAVTCKGLELALATPVFNVAPGSPDALDCQVVNRTSAEREWTFQSSSPLVSCQPGGGKLPPGASAQVKLTAQTKDAALAIQDVAVGVKAASGLSDSVPVKLYVQPAYQPPKLPEGPAVFLEDLPKGMLKSHRTRGGELKWWLSDEREPRLGPAVQKATCTIGDKTYQHGLWALPHHETVYKLEGGGFAAFAADVGVNAGVRKGQFHVPGLKVCFEIYLDGRLVASSGLMGDADPPRTLLAGNLAGAKEIKLLTRMERLGDTPNNYTYPGYLGYLCHWADARFFKAK